MNRTLWTVISDHQPVAVVAAEALENARRIATALVDHDDVPRRATPQVVPCPPEQRLETLNRARDLGCGDSFLACVRGGMFLTHIDGLALA